MAIELDELEAALRELCEELDYTADEDATPEEVAEVRQFAADFLHRYDALLNRANSTDRRELERMLGRQVEHVRDRLLQLR